ncbi:hypothetical protein [Palleronia sp.]|uniref:hypothetical protein n=1 Tax=Palleronia sp. TaxID=1940284 RepID=UPI0035C79349
MMQRATQIVISVCLLGIGPAAAESLCGVRDAKTVLAAIDGQWTSHEKISLESSSDSYFRVPEPAAFVIRAGRIESPFLDSLQGQPLPLELADAPIYDVDAVDELLEVTRNEELADLLSDTPCGPEDLPQFVAHIPDTDGISAGGTVTLIPYFDDRVLKIAELELASAEALLFMTGVAYMTPANPE